MYEDIAAATTELHKPAAGEQAATGQLHRGSLLQSSLLRNDFSQVQAGLRHPFPTACGC